MRSCSLKIHSSAADLASLFRLAFNLEAATIQFNLHFQKAGEFLWTNCPREEPYSLYGRVCFWIFNNTGTFVTNAVETLKRVLNNPTFMFPFIAPFANITKLTKGNELRGQKLEKDVQIFSRKFTSTSRSCALRTCILSSRETAANPDTIISSSRVLANVSTLGVDIFVIIMLQSFTSHRKHRE